MAQSSNGVLELNLPQREHTAPQLQQQLHNKSRAIPSPRGQELWLKSTQSYWKKKERKKYQQLVMLKFHNIRKRRFLIIKGNQG